MLIAASMHTIHIALDSDASSSPVQTVTVHQSTAEVIRKVIVELQVRLSLFGYTLA